MAPPFAEKRAIPSCSRSRRRTYAPGAAGARKRNDRSALSPGRDTPVGRREEVLARPGPRPGGDEPHVIHPRAGTLVRDARAGPDFPAGLEARRKVRRAPGRPVRRGRHRERAGGTHEIPHGRRQPMEDRERTGARLQERHPGLREVTAEAGIPRRQQDDGWIGSGSHRVLNRGIAVPVLARNRRRHDALPGLERDPVGGPVVRPHACDTAGPKLSHDGRERTRDLRVVRVLEMPARVERARDVRGEQDSEARAEEESRVPGLEPREGDAEKSREGGVARRQEPRFGRGEPPRRDGARGENDEKEEQEAKPPVAPCRGRRRQHERENEKRHEHACSRKGRVGVVREVGPSGPEKDRERVRQETGNIRDESAPRRGSQSPGP